jgi:hypothetical protein
VLRRVILAVVPGACVLLASCGRDPSDTFDDARRAARSWTSTLAMTARQWQQGRVPSLYVRQTLDAARESLDEQKKKLAKTPEPRRHDLEQEVARVERRIASLGEAVGRDDRDGAKRVSEALGADLNLTAAAPGSEALRPNEGEGR